MNLNLNLTKMSTLQIIIIGMRDASILASFVTMMLALLQIKRLEVHVTFQLLTIHTICVRLVNALELQTQGCLHLSLSPFAVLYQLQISTKPFCTASRPNKIGIYVKFTCIKTYSASSPNVSDTKTKSDCSSFEALPCR